MGVVYYANYLVYFERARNELLRDAEYSYVEMEKNGLMLPVVEAQCRYHRPAYYDDLLKIAVWFAGGRGARLKVMCEVVRDNTLLVSGYTIHACISLKSSRPVRLPEEILARITDTL